MSLTIIYSDINSILDGYAEGIKYELTHLMDEIADDLVGTKNILGLYEADSRIDDIKEQMSDELVKNMIRLINKFNVDMKTLIEHSEKDFKAAIKDLHKKR